MAKKGPARFRFSPRPNRAHQIKWRRWGAEAFAEAQRLDRPILLAIAAAWCHWCHVMDETSYSDEEIVSYINQHYVPIRVDNDQRPDVSARYNMGGWPTTALLTPEGEVLTGGTYVPPEQLRQLLPQMASHYKVNRDEIVSKLAALEEQRKAAAASERAPLGQDVLDKVLASVTKDYDPAFGGFGDLPKFHHTDAIDLLLYAYRKNRDPNLLEKARKTLESVAKGEIFDQEWGGFFRYAARPDWSGAYCEKMLEDNAGLLRNLLALYRATGDKSHLAVARRTIDYLDTRLSDPDKGFFYGSQDADEQFYRLPAAEREGRQQPYVDRTCYTDWTAMAASAYLEASWTLGQPELRERAIRALAFLWDNCRDPDKGMYHFNDGTPAVPGLLADQAYTARALLDAYEVAADRIYLKRAQELAAFMMERFVDEEGGGLFDVWDEHERLGRLRERRKSIQENAICAELFVRLHTLTGKGFYHKVAQAVLEAFSSTYQVWGYLASPYGKAVDMFQSGLARVYVVGDPGVQATRDLQLAALAVDVPAVAVQVFDPKRDGGRLDALMLPKEFTSVAYVYVGSVCSAPLANPAAIAETVRDMQAFAQALS